MIWKRKHQCQIDLKYNVLHAGEGDVSVPFLQEKAIPAEFLVEEKDANQGIVSSPELSTATKKVKQSSEVPSHVIMVIMKQ